MRIFPSTGTRTKTLVFLVVAIVSIISTSLNLKHSQAAVYDNCHVGVWGDKCNKVGKQCNTECGIPIYHNDRMNGIEPVGCQNSNTFTGYGVAAPCSTAGSNTGTCTSVIKYPYTIDWCANNAGLKATVSGKLYVYTNSTDIKITLGLKSYHITSKDIAFKDTGLQVSVNDWIKLYMVSHDPATGDIIPAIGWRQYEDGGYLFNNNIAAARALAAANGYTIISEQDWGDAATPQPYDTFDFNDAYVVLAVKNGVIPTPTPPVPDCSGNTVGLNVAATEPAGIILGGNAKFSVAISNTGLYKFLSDSFTPTNTSIVNPLDHNLNCNPGISRVGDTNCYIQNRGSVNAAPDTSATWKLNYQNCVGAVCSPTCTATVDFTIHPYPSFMLTQRGIAFVGNLMTQPYMPKPPLYSGFYFSTGLFSSRKPVGDHNPTNQLSSNFTAAPYQDVNNHDLSWYTSGLLNDPKYTPVTINVPSTTALTNSYLSTIFSTGLHIIHVTGGDAVFSGSAIDCKGSNIFVIDGSATFQTTIQNDSSTNSACLFLIRDTLVFEKSGTADNFDGFFIANSVNTQNKSGKLIITGGIVLQGATQATAFARNINNPVVDAASIFKDQPSEQIIYEGARYIDHFGSILSGPFQLSIRELPFISAQ